MKLFKDLKRAVTNEPDIDYLLEHVQAHYLTIETKALELIKKLKESKADTLTIEWQLLKLLRKYGVPISPREFRKRHIELYQ